jgi:FAD:protein FMN transferase
MFNFIALLLTAALSGAATASAAPTRPAIPLVVVQEYVMGTVGEVRVYRSTEPAKARPAAAAAMAEIRALDHLMAVQRPASDVSRVNRDGHAGPVVVDPRVIELLQASVAVSRLTNGAFDVTVLPVVRAWGFTDGTPAEPAAGISPRVAGYRSLRIAAAAHTVSFADAAAAIDLGGIGKGYALDRARDILRAYGVQSAWLDLGGNVATVGLPPDAARWQVGIRDPRHPGRLLGRVAIAEASVSTSSDEIQFVEGADGRQGHIIDPRTRAPARGLVSATVIARSAMQADALSTAAFVLGRKAAAPVLRQAGVQSVLAQLDDRGHFQVAASRGAAFDAEPTIATPSAVERHNRSES